MKEESQVSAIERYLKTGHPISPRIALSLYGCMRLASRIDELRKRGLPIVTKIIRANGKKWAEYSLVVPAEEEHRVA